MHISHELASFTTVWRRVPWGAWFEGGSEGDGSGTDPNAGVDGGSDPSSVDSGSTYGGADTSTDTSGGGSTDTTGGGGDYSYDPFGGVSSTSGGDTTGYNPSTGTYDWGNTANDAMIQSGLDQSAAFNASPDGTDTNPDYGTGIPFDQWSGSQQAAYFNSPDFSNISQAGLAFGDQQPGATGGGGIVYYNPTTGQTSTTQTPGSVPVTRDPVTGAIKPAAPGGTVPIMNTQYEIAKLQEATKAAQLAYDYWHNISGSDQLAFEKAQLAATTAYQQGQLAIGQGQVGVSALKVAGDLSANPFRQQQTLWGIGANPYLSNAVGAVAGQYDLPKFQGAGVSSAGSNTLSDLAGRMGGTGTSSANGSPMDFQSAVNAMPDPNKVVARNFYQLDPASQAYVVSGIQAKTGLDPNVITDQIKATLPQFKSPSFGLADLNS